MQHIKKKNIFIDKIRLCKSKHVLLNPLRFINDVLQERIHFSSILLTNVVPPQPEHNELDFGMDKLWLVMFVSVVCI